MNQYEVKYSTPERGLVTVYKNGEFFGCYESNTATDKLIQELEKNSDLLHKAKSIIEMFTDQKSTAFPNGRILKSYGVNGCKDFHHVFNDETQRRARDFLKILTIGKKKEKKL